ncbi:MAG: AMP nucleosidase [Paracoccaceae bacterium]
MAPILSPEPVAPERFDDARAAVARLTEIYERHTAFLRGHFEAYLSGHAPEGFVRACYPRVRLVTRTHARLDTRLSYGFVTKPGRHETTVTRPDVLGAYLVEQIGLLIHNHGEAVEVDVSDEPIPVHFAYARDINAETAGLRTGEPPEHPPLRDLFDVPDLARMDDAIVEGRHEPAPGKSWPLAPYRAERTDYSLHRLLHYTGTEPGRFQNFVIFTNYQFYVEAFVALGRARIEEGDPRYARFVEPGEVVTEAGGHGVRTRGEPPARMPQMPAYHLVADDHSGITMINIGAGPSNARTMTDHVAVLRPHLWLMLGHCAGLRNSQRLGDYVLAHAYMREDHVLDDALPPWVPIPALAEVQVALEQAVAEVTGQEGYDLKAIMRTGTVASVDDRNWELGGHRGVLRRLSQARAIALDMESATIAANGFRCRVPYGTLLCVSDKPLHGEIKLAGMAGDFYRRRVRQHLEIGLAALERLKRLERGRLHSRKLRSFAEVAFQ